MDFCLIAEATSFDNFLHYAKLVAMVGLGLSFVVFVHELGHFLAAKLCGVKCEKFYIGFDPPIKIGPISLPRTLGKFRWGETEYGIGVIPLGGYVKMLGQDDNPANAQRERERVRLRKQEAEAAGEDFEEGEFELDPRSFPAKSVIQRMFIISAGVAMNVLFGVIMAAIAYGMGVPYTPCEISSVTPGDPAWVEGLQSGDKIIQIGREGTPDEHLRFLWELRNEVAKASLGQSGIEPLDILVRRGTQEVWFEVKPTDRLKEALDLVSIGIRAPSSTTLDAEKPALAGTPAAAVESQLKPGGRIVAVDGIRLSEASRNERGDLDGTELERLLAERFNQSVTLTIERPDGGGEVEVALSPRPLRRFGLQMKMGPVVAVRKDSPAARAGLRAGDVLVSINGEPVGDPVTLPQRLAVQNSEPWEVVVRRGEGSDPQSLTVTVQPEGPPLVYAESTTPGPFMSLESLGLAYSVSAVVAALDAGESENLAQLQPGDRLVQAQFIVTEGQQELAEKHFGRAYASIIQPRKIEDAVYSWPMLLGNAQDVLLPPAPDSSSPLPAMSLKLTFLREGTKHEVTLNPDDLQAGTDDAYNIGRGLVLKPLSRIHHADGWVDAMQLGLRETREKLSEVCFVLFKLVTGKISPKRLGGPIAIAQMAGMEASQGVPRLLLFLTFLSANLAVLNFLPIPVLDGGHMVFLVAEAVTGRPVDERWQVPLTLIGFACLVGLMIFVFGNDIRRIFG